MLNVVTVSTDLDHHNLYAHLLHLDFMLFMREEQLLFHRETK